MKTGISNTLPFSLENVQQNNLIKLTEMTLALANADKEWFLYNVMNNCVNRWEEEDTSRITLFEILEIATEIAPKIMWSKRNQRPVSNISLYLRITGIPYTKSYGKFPPFISLAWGKKLRAKYPAELEITRLHPINYIGPHWLLKIIHKRMMNERCLFDFGSLILEESSWEEWKK